MVNFPIVIGAGTATLLHGEVAHINLVTNGHRPFIIRFTMAVSHGIVGTKLVCVISGGSAIDGGLVANSPVVVFIPIGAVDATDIDHTTGVGFADHRFAKTGYAVVEPAGNTAVTNHHAVFAGVGHGVHVSGVELGISPAGIAAMGGVVDIATTFIGFGSDFGSALSGSRIEVVVGIDAMGSVEVLAGGIVDGSVAM